ncbi:MAG: aminoglycoside 6-adenylyltransferase [Tissierellia bacterium]|nr:aminoglycoside 6-adenylyltransferase [Tissierellia bacterium]
MDSFNLTDIKNRIKKIDNVRVFIRVDSMDGAHARNIKEFDFILGLSHIDSFYLLKDLFFDEKDLILKKEDHIEQPYSFYSIKAVTNKNVKFKIGFVGVESLNHYLNNISSYTLIYDKDKSLFREKKYDESLVFKSQINESNFKQEAISFFMNLTETASALSKRDLLVANFMYDVCKKDMLDLLRLYVYVKYEKKVIVGKSGQELSRHLDEDYLDAFIKSFNTISISSFWDSIFSLASLHRKLGLEISRKENYYYPKKEDVDTMNYLRFLYDKFGRKI